MYGTCLFCHHSLGRNEALEHFPVGRRLAFDAAKGRLWVVCASCERWNLTPLEERWEAIEEAEARYRGTRLRAATDQIGLARLRDGTELVRIGAPLRPELAAWRYGDQFGRRRRRQLLVAGAGISALGAVVAGGVVAGAGVGGMGWIIARLVRTTIRGNPRSVVARIPTDDRRLLRVRLAHLSETTVVAGDSGPIALELRHEAGRARLEGREALRVASALMPKVNRYGGTKQAIASAVDALEAERGAEGYLARLAHLGPAWTRILEQPARRLTLIGERPDAGLFGLPPIHRLAFEMALHEESERRAMEGELAELEQAWRAAEEVAAIADDLLVPPAVAQALERMRGREQA